MRNEPDGVIHPPRRDEAREDAIDERVTEFLTTRDGWRDLIERCFEHPGRFSRFLSVTHALLSERPVLPVSHFNRVMRLLAIEVATEEINGSGDFCPRAEETDPLEPRPQRMYVA